MLERADITRAAERLAGVAHRTPVLHSRRIDALVGAEVYCKAEVFQRTGSFKFRGAYNAVAALDEAPRARGVVTASSGNHGAALAHAAALWGTTATVVMPDDAPANKRAATEGYGATIVTYDRYREDRDALARTVAEATGATLIPPYDHWDVMAGQGTLAAELLEEVPDLDTLVVCVGGGGLLAGCATAARADRPSIHIVGVEPLAGNDTQQSFALGHRVTLAEVPRSIADGQLTAAPGELTFEVNRRRADAIVTVTDAEIVAAMVVLFETLKVVVEPSGASAFAALLAGSLRQDGRALGGRVGVTLSGGNIEARRFAELIANPPGQPAEPTQARPRG